MTLFFNSQGTDAGFNHSTFIIERTLGWGVPIQPCPPLPSIPHVRSRKGLRQSVFSTKKKEN